MAKNTVVYPVVFTKSQGEYVVYVPDLDIYTEGKDMADAIFMARDAIGLMGLQLEDDGKSLPVAGGKEYKLDPGDVVSYVDVDLMAYRQKHDNKMVRKNCTIPFYLNVEAEKKGLNFSRVLTEALKVACAAE